MNIYSKKFLSVIIPCYNEGKRIGNTLKKIIEFFNNIKINYEIIVVNDGSTDDTKTKLQKIKEEHSNNVFINVINNNQNCGKGFAVKQGIMASNSEYIYFTDADLSTPIEEIVKFLERKEYDIVIGSRAVKNSKILVHQPFYRELAGKVFNKLLKFILGLPYNDTQCGAKLFKSDVAKFVFSKTTINRFSFDAEVLFIAKKYKYKVLELPVVWSHSKNSKVKFFVDGIKMLDDVIKIKINDLRGLYGL